MSDIQVTALLDIVNKKKAEIAALEVKPNWVTNCVFKYNINNNDLINVQTANQKQLIDILIFLLRYEHFHKEACNRLGVTDECTWLGYSVSQWETDLKTRLSRLIISTKKIELDTLEKRLNNLMSADLKTQLELDEITKLLK
jgi:hypothetical protein